MRLTKLTLTNVGVFKNAEFVFPEGKDPKKADTYIFVGPNGSGKTTALLALAQTLLTRTDTGITKRMRSGSEVWAEAVLHGSSGPERHTGGFRQARAGASLEPDDLYRVEGVVPLIGNYRGFHRELEDRPSPIGVFGYSGARSFHGFELTAISEPRTEPHRLAVTLDGRPTNRDEEFAQWVATTFAKIAFADQRGDTETAERRQGTLNRIGAVVREVTGSEFSLLVRDEPLAVGCRLAGVELGLETLSEGVKSILSWVGDLVMRIDRTAWPEDGKAPLDRSHIVFLDEVEVHLHPLWQRRVLTAMQSLLPNSQLFVTTHSPFVVASATDAFIYKLDGGTVSAPIPATDGQSVLTILRDVLGVTEEFSDAIEQELTEFERECNSALRGDAAARQRAQAKALGLATKGPELAAIVERQLKILDRQLKASPAA